MLGKLSNTIQMTFAWTKDEAVKYCIEVAELNFFNEISTKKAKTILKIYQDMLFKNNEKMFYKKIWLNCVLNVLKFICQNVYDEETYNDAIKHFELKYKREKIPEDFEQFISSTNNLILNNDNSIENIDFLGSSMKEIRIYIVKQLNKLYNKNISGPECLLRYIYPYASELILPKDIKSLWITPSMRSLSPNLDFITLKDEPPTHCSFCKNIKVFQFFIAKYTHYNYFLFAICNNCEDFKKYYSLCFLNKEDAIIDIPLNEKNKLDFSVLKK